MSEQDSQKQILSSSIKESSSLPPLPNVFFSFQPQPSIIHSPNEDEVNNVADYSSKISPNQKQRGDQYQRHPTSQMRRDNNNWYYGGGGGNGHYYNNNYGNREFYNSGWNNYFNYNNYNNYNNTSPKVIKIFFFNLI